jgi:hypothetical protein
MPKPPAQVIPKEEAGAKPAAGPEKPPEKPPEGASKPKGMPRILSESEAREYRKLPGLDGEVERYGPEIDWRMVPPWRQASFYGLRAKGQVFVFVVDCSGSMGDDLRLYKAKQELRKCIGNLKYPQSYRIIFYSDEVRGMPGGVPVSAGAATNARALAWMDLIEAEGGTDPRGAIDQAVGLRPDAIFLLSDGAYPEGTEKAIEARNGGKVPIHCIDLSGGAAGDQLRRIAEASGGQYAPRN